jgi:hypothetical protein
MYEDEKPLESINVDEITIIGEQVPVGKYRAKLIASEGKLSRKSKPMVQATWEIVEGEQQFKEVPMWYHLNVTRKKNKKGVMQTYASGVADMKQAFAVAGQPVPSGFQFPLDKDKAAALYAKIMRDKVCSIVVIQESYDEKDEAGNPTGEKKTINKAYVARSDSGPVAAPVGAGSFGGSSVDAFKGL